MRSQSASYHGYRWMCCNFQKAARDDWSSRPGVRAATIPSAYRIHFNQTVSEVSTPAGRNRFARPTADAPSVDALSWYARHELDRVRAKLGQ